MTELVSYAIRIRPNFEVLFDLPIDITATEAQRLCTFIFNIPLSVRLAIAAAEQEQLTKPPKSTGAIDTKTVK